MSIEISNALSIVYNYINTIYYIKFEKFIK